MPPFDGDFKEEFKGLGDDIRDLKSKQAQEWKSLGQRVDDLKAASAAKGDVETIRTDLDGMKSDLEARLKQIDALERRAARPHEGSGGGAETFSDALAAALDTKSEDIAANATRGVQVDLAFEKKSIMLSGMQNTVQRTALGRPFHDDEIVRMPRRPVIMRSAFPTIPISGDTATFTRQTLRDLKAAAVAEGAMKPESNLGWGMAQTPVQTIAHWFHVSRQALDDLPQLQAEIESEGLYGLQLAEDEQLTTGDGNAPNLSGLLNPGNFTAYNNAVLPDVAPADAIDDIRVAKFQVENADLFADWVMVSREDAAKIDMMKDADGLYIFARNAQTGALRPWGMDMMVNPSLSAGQFIVGSRMAAKIYDRAVPEIAISDQDRDNFVKNMYTIRLEERIALAVRQPLAIVSGSFT